MTITIALTPEMEEKLIEHFNQELAGAARPITAIRALLLEVDTQQEQSQLVHIC